MVNLFKSLYFGYVTLFSWPALLLNKQLPNYKHLPKNTAFLLTNKYLLIIKPHLWRTSITNIKYHILNKDCNINWYNINIYKLINLYKSLYFEHITLFSQTTLLLKKHIPDNKNLQHKIFLLHNKHLPNNEHISIR